MQNSKKEVTITCDINKAQVDSVISLLNKSNIRLTLNVIEYNEQKKIQKIEGSVSSITKKLNFASDRFKKLDIYYHDDLKIKINAN